MAVSWLCLCVLLSASLSACTTPDEDIAVGLIELIDVSDEHVQHAAAFASQNANCDLLEVLEAKTQVVAGVYYYLSVMVRNNGNSQYTGQMKCDIEVHELPWEESLSVEKFECLLE